MDLFWRKKSSVHEINVIQRWGQGFSLTWSNVWGVTSELPNLTSPHSWLYHSAWLCLDFKWTSSLDCTFNLEFPFWMYSSGENSVESKSASSAECSPVVWNEARRRIQFNVNVGCRRWGLPISIFNLIWFNYHEFNWIESNVKLGCHSSNGLRGSNNYLITVIHVIPNFAADQYDDDNPRSCKVVRGR